MSVEITKCRMCGSDNMLEIYDLGIHALSCRFPKGNEPDPIEAPLVLVKCDDREDTSHCGLLQLSHNTSGDELYLHTYGYRSGLNNTMISHLTALTNSLTDVVALEAGDIVLDIGSNDCTLLKSYKQGSALTRIGIDPTGNQFQEFYPNDITLVPDYFTASKFQEVFGNKKAKVVTSISMFYDLPDPIAIARDIKSILHEKGVWVTEQSYCVTMLERNSFDTVCHEHLEYYTLKQFQYLADKVGLKIIDVTLNECNGGSFRITFAHEGIYSCRVTDMITAEEKLSLQTLEPLKQFVSRCETMKTELVSFLKSEKDQGKSIYLYGASTKGNTLLEYYELDNTIITAAAERNPEKYGRRTPRTNIPIIPEKEMREAQPDYLLVLPWHFKEEFLEREQEYMNNGGSIIFPLPSLEIHTSKKSTNNRD